MATDTCRPHREGAQGQHQPRPPPSGRGERTDGYQSLCGLKGGERDRRPPPVVEAEAAHTVTRAALMSPVAPGPARTPCRYSETSGGMRPAPILATSRGPRRQPVVMAPGADVAKNTA